MLALSKKWPLTGERYMDWFKSGNRFELGEFQVVSVGDGISVINLIGQHGVGVSKKTGAPIRYDAIEKGLTELNKHLPAGYSIHMPRMGCGLAGGSWEQMEPIIERALAGRQITVYDFEASPESTRR